MSFSLACRSGSNAGNLHTMPILELIFWAIIAGMLLSQIDWSVDS
jgi:hypothetical protein